MVRRSGIMLMLVLALTLGAMAAQDAEKKASADAVRAQKAWSFYKLDLTVRELDGTKVVNSRTYTLTQRSDEWGQLRVGSRIPTEKAGYMDVGLNLDSRVQDREDATAFDWRLDLSSLAAETGPNGLPVVRQVKSNGSTLLTVGKPIVMSTVDDLSSTHKFVFEVTATKLK